MEQLVSDQNIPAAGELPAPLPADSLQRPEVFQNRFNSVHAKADAERKTVLDNRDIRRCQYDVETMRANGELKAHETFIGVKVIDENIRKALPNHLAYLKQSRRLAIFEPKRHADRMRGVNTELVESEFTRVMTYPGWELTYINALDGSAAHGWDFVEVVYHPTYRPGADEDDDAEYYPANVCVEHVGADMLVFDTRVADIQHSEIVARAYEITTISLAKMAKDNNFEPGLVAEITEKLKNYTAAEGSDVQTSDTDQCVIYKAFFKENGQVFVAWYSHDIKKFLTPPKPFWNGRTKRVMQQELLPPTPENPFGELTAKPVDVPVYETKYPIFTLFFRQTEERRIVDRCGQVDEAYYVQESASVMMSAFVNQNVLATKIMASPDADNPDVGGAPKQLDCVIDTGKIWDRPMRFFTTPPPAPELANAIDKLSQRNAESTGDIAWTVNNRQDSRKTAAEIQAATQQSSLLNSTQVLMFSIFLRDVMTCAWSIIRSAAARNEFPFCAGPDGVNNVELLAIPFNVKAAGDVDYVARAERIQAMQQDWPIIGTTAAAQPFLSDYLRLRYPDTAETYIVAIQNAQAQSAQLAQSLATLLKEAVTDDNGNLLPEWQPHAQQIQQLLGAAGMAGAPQGGTPGMANPAADAGAAGVPQQPAGSAGGQG